MSKKSSSIVINQERCYYIRETVHRHPRVTVCLMEFGDGIICRGLALCSFSEKRIDKKKGRRIARSRALKAYEGKIDSCAVERFEAMMVAGSCGGQSDVDFYFPWVDKSYYDATLNEFEKRILNKNNRKEEVDHG